MDQEIEKKKPLRKGYVSLGEGKGIQITVWQNNLQLTRVERDENKEWKETQEINLAPMVLKELFWQLPRIIDEIDYKKD